MSARKQYTRESVHRALSHHELNGAVTFLSPPGVGQSFWRISVRGLHEVFELSLANAHALCLGLAAGERTYSPNRHDAAEAGRPAP